MTTRDVFLEKDTFRVGYGRGDLSIRSAHRVVSLNAEHDPTNVRLVERRW